MKRLVFPILILLGFLAYKWYQLPGYNKGEKSPDFSATLLNGKDFKLSDLQGDVVLLDFWGSWCGPCRKENPELVKLYNEYESKKLKSGASFEIVSVAIETKADRCEKAIKKDGLRWPYHIVLLDRFKSPLAQQYKVREIPTKYLLDTNGEITMVNPSFEEIRQYLNQ